MAQVPYVGRWGFTSLQHLRSYQDGYCLTFDSAHSWERHISTPQGNQATVTISRYPTHSHYPDIETTSLCPILIMLSTRIGSDKNQFHKMLVWLNWELNSRSPAHEARALPIRPPRPVVPYVMHNVLCEYKGTEGNCLLLLSWRWREREILHIERESNPHFLHSDLQHTKPALYQFGHRAR